MSGCLLFVGRARTPGGEQEQREVHADPRGEAATREKSRQRAEVSMCMFMCVFVIPTGYPRQYTEIEKLIKNIAKFFQSFISPRIIAATQSGFLFLKALYLRFQMHTS